MTKIFTFLVISLILALPACRTVPINEVKPKANPPIKGPIQVPEDCDDGG